jgi:fructose-specific component phosphotransferase system IIB-like protein
MDSTYLVVVFDKCLPIESAIIQRKCVIVDVVVHIIVFGDSFLGVDALELLFPSECWLRR